MSEQLPATVEAALLRRHLYALRRLLLAPGPPDRDEREAAAQRLTEMCGLDPIQDSSSQKFVSGVKGS